MCRDDAENAHTHRRCESARGWRPVITWVQHYLRKAILGILMCELVHDHHCHR
jgi:hypothetical protein